MRDDAIRSTFPLIETEGNEKDDANNKIGVDVWVLPFIGPTCPIQREK
jgi:hypothetical protein